MTAPRRRVLAVAGGLLAAPAVAQPRSVRMLVGFAPGGAADTVARLVAPRMAAVLGQPIVVENRTGASATVAAAAMAASPPDGTTLFLTTLTHAANPHLYRNLPFDYATAFAPVAQVVAFPQVLAVRRDFPATNLAEFIAVARGRPEPITYGTPGNATAQHMAGELFRLRTGIRLEHVPYRGGSDAARDLAAGVVEANFNSPATLAPAFASGARPIVAATARRILALPDLPTTAESGVPDMALTDWCGLFAPAATPPDVVRRTSEACAEALRAPEVTTRLAALSAEPVGSAPDAFRAFVAAESARLGEIIRAAGITLS